MSVRKAGDFMVRIAVLDNQKEDLESITDITKMCMHKMGIAYKMQTYDRPMDLVYDLLEGASFDIYLLDIEMEQMTGIEVAREIRKTDKYENIFSHSETDCRKICFFYAFFVMWGI